MSRDRHQESWKHPQPHAGSRKVWDHRGSAPSDVEDDQRSHPSARSHKMYGAQHDEARQQIRELRSRY